MERKIPQLEMILFVTKFEHFEPIALSSNLNFFNEIDSNAWLSIINESFNYEFDEKDFNNEMNSVINGDKSNLIFIKDIENGLIATGSIIIEDQIAELHYIAVKESFRGKELGYKISLRLILKAIKVGVKIIKLHTDDYRVPAIKTYLKLGFTPNIISSNQIVRWDKIIKENNLNWNKS